MRTISRERRDELRRNEPLCRERCYYEMRKRQLFECTRGLTLCALLQTINHIFNLKNNSRR